ncbi:MAG: D-glycero-alpha-D-manno-heptose-1,7-bisphosphate 7-phosphatase [Bacteroidales bacterium]|jgi:D,D-heptose 1,7-bisphosphate phosphatase
MSVNKTELLNCTTIFLDRDGVINKRIVGGYVADPKEFIFLDGVLEAFEYLSKTFEHIIIITNQQGISKGIVSEEQVNKVHEYMISTIEQNNGKIDKIYFCPDKDNGNSFYRKPNIGMAIKANEDFPTINFKKSILVGDMKSDILVGKQLCMKTIKIGNQDNEILADLNFDSLISFVNYLKEIKTM